MATDVIMPKVDMDQETGTVAQWLKKEGDEVKQGEIILEIETDKVAIEVEAPATGILANILVGVGETVPIATTIAYILAAGRRLPSSDAAGCSRRKTSAAAGGAPVQQTDWEVPVTPVARNMAAASGVDLTAVPGSGPRRQGDEEGCGSGSGRAGSHPVMDKERFMRPRRRGAWPRNRDLALETIAGQRAEMAVSRPPMCGFGQAAARSPQSRTRRGT